MACHVGIPLPSRVKVGKNRSTQTDFLRLMDLGLALVNLSKHLDFDEKALNSKRMFKPTPFCIMLLHKRLKPQLRDVINELPPYLICHVRVDNEVHLFFCNFIQVNSSNRLEGAWL